MDKKNLYYIVLEGTNQREMNKDLKPFIANMNAAQIRLKLNHELSKFSKLDRVDMIMSISDYEKKFGDDSE